MIEVNTASVDAQSQGLGRQVRKAAHHALARRASRPGTISHKLEHGLKRTGKWLWVEVRRHSVLSVTGAAAVGIGAATAIGVGELAIGAAVAYAAYNVWVRGEDPEDAIDELAGELEHHAH